MWYVIASQVFGGAQTAIAANATTMAPSATSIAANARGATHGHWIDRPAAERPRSARRDMTIALAPNKASDQLAMRTGAVSRYTLLSSSVWPTRSTPQTTAPASAALRQQCRRVLSARMHIPSVRIGSRTNNAG